MTSDNGFGVNKINDKINIMNKSFYATEMFK